MNNPEFPPGPDPDALDILERAPLDSYQDRWLVAQSRRLGVKKSVIIWEALQEWLLRYGYHPFRPGKHVGFIYRNGVLIDLNTITPSNSGFIITDAVGINDSGQILCTATNTSGNVHAVLLAPQ
jgi:hypothetical protein